MVQHPPASFLSLPVEIRMQIYRWLVPHGHRYHVERCRPAGSKREDRLLLSGWLLSESTGETPNTATVVLRLNRKTCSEARDILYGENTFTFIMRGHIPKSGLLRPMLPFTLDATSLRGLRKIELTVKLVHKSREAATILRRQLQNFAKVFADRNGGAPFAIRSFKINFDSVVRVVRGCRYLGDQLAPEAHWQYVLEELVVMQSIPHVQIEGHVHPWFAKCLESALTTNARKPKLLEFPNIKQKRKRAGFVKKRTISVSTRTWTMPKYDWASFAEEFETIPQKDIENFRQLVMGNTI